MKKRSPLLLLVLLWSPRHPHALPALKAVSTVGRNFKEVASSCRPFRPDGAAGCIGTKETVELHLGHTSGLRGVLLSILLAAAAAGPVCGLSHRGDFASRGTRLLNIVVFLTAWAALTSP